MKIEIKKITVTIDSDAANDIINCLTKSLDPFEGKEEYPKAAEFNQQLRAVFMNYVNGIHFIQE